MKKPLVRNLMSRFGSYHDIVSSVSDHDLQAKINVSKTKCLAQHLWCVIGARESYAKALAAGSWTGFSCSIQEKEKSAFSKKLLQSAETVKHAIDNVSDWTETHTDLLLSLYEHEIMHEGQIIRLLYALGLDIPKSVKWA